MEKEMTAVEKFYQDVADLLGIENNYEYDRLTVGGIYRTRWNNRKAGNGRFEGYGLIRFFGPEAIHLALHTPCRLHAICTSTEEALAKIKTAVDTAKLPS